MNIHGDVGIYCISLQAEKKNNREVIAKFRERIGPKLIQEFTNQVPVVSAQSSLVYLLPSDTKLVVMCILLHRKYLTEMC